MKKSILMLMVAGLIAAMPALAAEQGHHDMDVKECIKHCAMRSESIDQKIERLQTEIEKGEATYSIEELRKLEAKLNEANYMLDSITKP